MKPSVCPDTPGKAKVPDEAISSGGFTFGGASVLARRECFKVWQMAQKRQRVDRGMSGGVV
jgi:hypothetical protein